MNDQKRSEELPVDSVQQGNKRWWTENTMSYDWHSEIGAPRFSQAWYDAVDRGISRRGASLRQRRHALRPDHSVQSAGGERRARDRMRDGASHRAHDPRRRARHGRRSFPDLRRGDTRRLELKGLSARVIECRRRDTSLRERLVRFRLVLGGHPSLVAHGASRAPDRPGCYAPDGECRIMVYNRASTWAYSILVRDHLLKGRFLRHSFEETLYSVVGRVQRAVLRPGAVRGPLSDLLSRRVVGRSWVRRATSFPCRGSYVSTRLRLLPLSYLKNAQAARGSFIFLTAKRPLTA